MITHLLLELREALLNYVNHYNQSIHSSLNGLCPQDRFFNESYLIKRLPEELIETTFLLEYERRVSADNVVMIDEIEYEVLSLFKTESYLKVFT
ncbi:hypothetical protein [Serpentinicella alkaliphila]|uniref:hypothetical protein n=1 Tax=Serpentinicella alkaliphila TaxID=1734049 RepID=UPI00201A9BD5|nr:hypothetical protein [Serpentinicella alkaliphila]